MKLRINIILSFVAHAIIFTAVLALAGKDAVLRLSERFTAVTLFEHQAAQEPVNSAPKSNKKPPIAVGKTVTGHREASPPDAPSSTHRQDREPPAAAPLKHTLSEEAAGRTRPSPIDGNGAVLQAGGAPGTSTGAMQLAIPGGEAPQGVQSGGRDRAVSSGRDVVNIIKAAIERAKNYPPMARKRGIEGTATTEFIINDRGYPEDIRIVRSSGWEILDNAAKNTILRASPFPLVKGGIEVPITFRIEKGR